MAVILGRAAMRLDGIGGVSTRRVDDLVQAMGPSGICKSPVGKPCQDSDERVTAFLQRPLEGDWPPSLARRHLPRAA